MQQLQLLERPQRVTEKSSISVLKQLVEVSVSCITYIRGLLPEANYELKEFSDTKLKVLKKKFSKESDKLLNILELGVFDAIEKHYLRQMTLGIFADPKTPDIFLECYHFYVTYPSDKNESKVHIHNNKGDLVTELNTMDNIKQQSLRMMRSLVVLVQTLTDLPDHCFLTFRLLYYDDITPKDYQPKYFIHYEHEHSFPCTPKVKAVVGTIQTPFHTMGMEVVSTCDELEPTQSQSQHPKNQGNMIAEKPPSTPMPAVKSTTDKIAELLEKTKLANSTLVSSSTTKPNPAVPLLPPQKNADPIVDARRRKNNPPPPTTTPRAPKPGASAVHRSEKPATGASDGAASVTSKTRCICEFHEEDSGMVLCEQCLHWSHVVCWGFYHEKDPRVLARPFFCHLCHPVPKKEEKKMVALFRTAIAVSWNEMRTTWDPEKLAKRIKVPLPMARKLVFGMVEMGIAEYIKQHKRKYYRMLKETNQGKQAVKIFFNPDVSPALPSVLLSEIKNDEGININTQDTQVLESDMDEEDHDDFHDEEEEEVDVANKSAHGTKAHPKARGQPILKPVLKRKGTKELKESRVNKKCKISAVLEPISVA